MACFNAGSSGAINTFGSESVNKVSTFPKESEDDKKVEKPYVNSVFEKLTYANKPEDEGAFLG